jgi:hypothetical protein
MRRLSAKVGVGVFLAAGVSVMSAGCTEDDSTLFIVGVAKIDSGCTYSAGASTTLLPRGQLDLGFDGSYQAGLVLANQMASRGQKTRSRTETSRIILEGAEVTLVLPSGATLRDTFSAPGAGFVDVSTGADPGFGILSVVVVPRPSTPQERQALYDAGYVLAEIKAFGKTLGGQEVESNVYRFPIEVCFGCLVTFPPSEIDTDTMLCRGSTGSETTVAPCFWGQDTQVVCSACAATYEVCRDPNLTI